MLGLLITAAIFLYLAYLVVSLLRDWYGIVGETIAAGERKHETTGQIALDIGKEAGIGAAKVAAGYALGAVLGGAMEAGSAGGVGGEGLSGAGGAFGGGGAAGSW